MSIFLGQVQNYDVRQRDPLLSTFSGHNLEVSGLAWSGDGKYLASSGNDNIINIWSNDIGNTNPTPIHQLTDHQAGVKAVAWCPWKNQVLASGGGKNKFTRKNIFACTFYTHDLQFTCHNASFSPKIRSNVGQTFV